MTVLINILIVFFLLLISYQIFLAYFGTIIEGMDSTTYVDYNTTITTTDAMALAQQNAGNISYLKNRLDTLNLDGVRQEVDDISGNVAQLSTQVNQILQAQADYSQQMLPSTTPVITGT
jgi:hypothetical protein